MQNPLLSAEVRNSYKSVCVPHSYKLIPMAAIDVAETAVAALTLVFVAFWFLDSALDNLRRDSNVIDFDD